MGPSYTFVTNKKQGKQEPLINCKYLKIKISLIGGSGVPKMVPLVTMVVSILSHAHPWPLEDLGYPQYQSGLHDLEFDRGDSCLLREGLVIRTWYSINIVCMCVCVCILYIYTHIISIYICITNLRDYHHHSPLSSRLPSGKLTVCSGKSPF